jgi:hypothetical protein
MNKIKVAYDYLFFSFYRFWEKAPSKWWSEWKSVLTISFFGVLLLLSLYGYIIFYFKILEDPFSNTKAGPALLGFLVYLFNHYYFIYKKKWKKKIDKFKYLSKSKDKIGIILIISFLLVIIVNLIYSFYLVSTVDWLNVR